MNVRFWKHVPTAREDRDAERLRPGEEDGGVVVMRSGFAIARKMEALL